MDFFEWQDRAHRSTVILVVQFAVAVAAVIVALHFAAALVLSIAVEGGAFERFARDPRVFGVVAAAAGIVIMMGCAICFAEIEEGGPAVARMVGGRRVEPAAAGDPEKRLLNVVEEMAIAAGLPVPEVYVLDGERGLNAFAAGWDPGHAAIGVTRGLLVQLPRDELQAVIAHEFSHILHGDMRLNLVLLGLLRGILLFHLLGRALLPFDGDEDEETDIVDALRHRLGILPITSGALLTVIGFVGALVGRILASAVSRQREFLADAAAAQFTRNPAALAAALRRLGGFAHGSRLRHAAAESIAHFLFGRYQAGDPFFDWFSTHPPLAARIRRIDPTFDGTFPPVPALADPGPPERSETALGRPVAGVAPGYTTVLAIDPARLAADIGIPVREHIDRAARILAELPPPLAGALEDRTRVDRALYALLLSRDPGLRTRQLALLAERADAAVRDQAAALADLVRPQPRAARLAMLHRALPAVRSLPGSDLQVLVDTTEALAAADQSIDSFEYALHHVLVRAIELRHGGRANRVQIYGMLGAAADASVLLSALAWAGGGGTAAVQAAFLRAADSMGKDGSRLVFQPAVRAGLADVDRALRAAAGFSPPLKRAIVGAGLQAVARDGRINDDEAEFLRAISAAIDVPVPLWVETAAA